MSTSSFGAASRVPGVGGGGGGDGEGDGEGEGDGAGDGDRDGPGSGEDRTGAGDRDVTSDVLEPGSVAAADVRVTGAGRRLGVDRPALAGSDAALDAAKSPPPSATVEAWARCWPPAISSAAVPATTSAAATAATPAAARGRRRTSCHQRGPGAMIGFGKPVRPNGTARWATLTRWARPAGLLSAHSSSTRLRRPAGGLTSGIAPSAGGSTSPVWRRHSFRATAFSQEPSWSGSRSACSLAVAMIKVSATASAASAGGWGSGSMNRQ